MHSTWVIIPVHNRREITLRCLKQLQDTGILDWATVLVVDDGSTDETTKAVESSFPDVHVKIGSGNLWWTGTTKLGMEYAMANGAETIIWLNDDTHPKAGTLMRIAAYSQTHNCITSARCRYMLKDPPEPVQGIYKTTYSLQLDMKAIGVDGSMDVHALRGNCLSIPTDIVRAIGYPDAKNLPHYHGDSDYTLRATEYGFRCVMLMDAWADEISDRGDRDASWLRGGIPLGTLWKRFLFVGSSYYWKANLIYSFRHFGLLGGSIRFLKPLAVMLLVTILRVFLPRRRIRI